MRIVRKTLVEKRGWMYDDVKDKKITRVQNKEDGSIISAVKFPNGKIRMKSKTSFTSDQAQAAQKILDSKSIMLEELDKMMQRGRTPIFELVGPENQIVVEYQNTELILLQIRNEDGSYMSEEDLKWYSMIMGIRQAEVFPDEFHNLDELLKLKETNQENIEGWIVTFEDGQMAKIKTDHYLQLHGLIGPDAFRENLLVKTILDGNIDDVISALVPGEKKDKIVTMNEKVSHKFNELVQEFIDLRGEYYNKYQENRKEFALANNKNPLFGSVMKTLNTSFRDVEKTAEGAVTEFILKQCRTLGSAKEFVEGI